MSFISLCTLPIFLALSALAPALSRADDGSGLRTSIAVDLLGQSGKVHEGKSDRFEAREAEISFFAPIDPTFDGTLTGAAHDEDGEYVFEVHEAFISTSKLIPRSRLKVGKFFLGIGRLNQFHRHDWPFVSAPKVHRELFGEEGAVDAGAEYGLLMPTDLYLDLTVGVTNGWTYGHSHDAGARPRTPTHYARLATYLDLPGEGGLQTGLNYLGRTDAGGTKRSIAGLDATAKWREARTLKFLLQSEIWHRTLAPEGAEAENTLGLYVFPQYGFTEQLSFGIRGDYYTVTSLKDPSGAKIENGTTAFVPTLTYKASEFSTFRLAYTKELETQPNEPTADDSLVEVQLTFILGAHPAHDF